MADTVQRLLEDMVPELEDLQKKNIFNKVEIQSLVSHRQSFEYKLRRQNVSKLDFLRYIQYELNLTALVEKRKVKLGIDKKGVSDFAAMRRLSFLYERSLRKFNNDVELWKQYLEYSHRIGSHHAISKILPRALQYNPKDISLWILNASWELERQGNIEGGRNVLQRALRLNENSMELWQAFFKMEVRFVIRMMERKRTLGLLASSGGSEKKKDGEENGEGEAAFDLRYKGGVAPSESDAPSAVDPLAQRQELALTQLLLPRAILRNAVKTKGLKDSLEFRLQFLKHMPTPYSAALSALDRSDVDEMSDGDTAASTSTSKLPASDPSRLHLATYAYNHNPADTLLDNFIKHNRLASSSSNLTEDQQTGGSYHIDFKLVLNDLFTSIKQDFAHEVHVKRLEAEYVYIKRKIEIDAGVEESEREEKKADGEEEDAEMSSSSDVSPASAAFAVFESALTPSSLESLTSLTQRYHTEHKSDLDVVATSAAGRTRVERLTHPKRCLWEVYIQFVTDLLRAEPTNRGIRTHLLELYRRVNVECETSGGQSIVTVSILLKQVELMIEMGQIQQAKETMEQKLPHNSASSSSTPSSSTTSFTSSFSLWSSYLDLLEKLSVLGTNLSSSTHEEESTKSTSKKRKKPTSADASLTSTSSSSVTSSFILTAYDRALESVSFDDRLPLYSRLLAYQNTLLLSSSSPDSLHTTYLAIHATYHRVLTSIPQLRGVETWKSQYLEWHTNVVMSELYQVITRKGKQQQQQPQKKQKTVKQQKKRATASEDEDEEDAEVDDDSLPSYIPSLTLTPVSNVRALMDSLLATPPLPLHFVQTCLRVETNLCTATSAAPSNSSSSSSSSIALHHRRMKDLYERGVLAYGRDSPSLWFSYLEWSRSAGSSTLASASASAASSSSSSTSIHYRATSSLRPEYQSEWAELQTTLVR